MRNACVAGFVAGLVGLVARGGDGVLHGYTDTPFIPGQAWRVHDDARPFPPRVVPGPYVAALPPSDAVVLFDGRSTDAWSGAETWTLADGVLIAGKADMVTKESFGDLQAHVEWMTPPPKAGDRVCDRGNSGVFLLDRYEVQIFDTHATNTIYADGMAGAIYGQHPPLANASRAPGEWQTFDIVLRAPRFAEGAFEPGRVTVFHNGVLVQNGAVLLGATRHKAEPVARPHAVPAPLRLQAHGSPVRFRNIWIRRLDSPGR